MLAASLLRELPIHWGGAGAFALELTSFGDSSQPRCRSQRPCEISLCHNRVVWERLPPGSNVCPARASTNPPGPKMWVPRCILVIGMALLSRRLRSDHASPHGHEGCAETQHPGRGLMQYAGRRTMNGSV